VDSGGKEGSIHNIQQLIREAAASVIPDVLGRVWQDIEYCLDDYKSHQWSPHRTSINTWKELQVFELFYNLIHV
jgi:hypothetical protein